MNVQAIREMARLIEELKERQLYLEESNAMDLAVPTLSYKTSSPLLRIMDAPRRASSSSTSSDRLTLDHPFTVLVVEDNPLNARIMTTMLKRANFVYKLAQNGAEGVELFKKHLPVLVLLDINMPIMNGFEACQEMRRVSSPYTHRIIAITALSTEAEKRKGRESGMDEWLTKPTRMAPLMRDIKRELMLAKLQRIHHLTILFTGWRREYEGVALSDPSTPSSGGDLITNV
jgi:CheY-like chemotaxis protein